MAYDLVSMLFENIFSARQVKEDNNIHFSVFEKYIIDVQKHRFHCLDRGYTHCKLRKSNFALKGKQNFLAIVKGGIGKKE